MAISSELRTEIILFENKTALIEVFEHFLMMKRKKKKSSSFMLILKLAGTLCLRT